MPENDQYPDNRHGTFTPVGIILIIAITAVTGVFVYARSASDGPPPQELVRPNPAAPVLPGTTIPADPPAQP